MKTIYIKKLKSGNYKVSDKNDYSEKASTKKGLKQIWNNIYSQSTNVWNRTSRSFKTASIIKATYSQSQTYYSYCEIDDFYKTHK